MKGYGQFCPVAKAAEIFAERWTPLILRDLLRGPRRFNEIHDGVPRMSQSLLAQRLKSLQRDGVLAKRPTADAKGWEYFLTPAGTEFGQAVESLGEWGMRHGLDKLQPEDLDPKFLMWAIEGHVNREALPESRLIIEFRFRGLPRERWWLLLERPNVELCLQDYGFDVDLLVTADLRAMTDVYLGRRRLDGAIEEGLIEVDGPGPLRRALPRWLGVSHFARYGQSPATTDHGYGALTAS